MRGSSKNGPVNLNPVQPHWIKIVYSQNEGTPMTVAATLDNQDHPALTESVKGLAWPKLNEFYLAKQFIILQ